MRILRIFAKGYGDRGFWTGLERFRYRTHTNSRADWNISVPVHIRQQLSSKNSSNNIGLCKQVKHFSLAAHFVLVKCGVQTTDLAGLLCFCWQPRHAAPRNVFASQAGGHNFPGGLSHFPKRVGGEASR